MLTVVIMATHAHHGNPHSPWQQVCTGDAQSPNSSQSVHGVGEVWYKQSQQLGGHEDPHASEEGRLLAKPQEDKLPERHPQNGGDKQECDDVRILILQPN